MYCKRSIVQWKNGFGGTSAYFLYGRVNINTPISENDLIKEAYTNGEFSYIKFRTIKEQALPYPTRICEKEIDRVFERKNIHGAIIGFINPSYVKGGIVYQGSHFHFISSNFNIGCHDYDFVATNVKVEIDQHSDFMLKLPTSSEFSWLDLDKDIQCPK